MVHTDKKTLTKALLKGKEVYSKRTKEKTIDRVLLNMIASSSFGFRGHGVPGEVIKAMPKEVRDILEECTAEDWNHRMEQLKTWTRS